MHLNVNQLIQHNLSGEQTGLPCFCTANEYVLSALLGYALQHNLPVCIEATCNQVNQYGGYTGLTPKMFQAWVFNQAKIYGLSNDKIILGGDHLGPNPWKNLHPTEAMDKAKQLVRDYVEAGFTKIHIDASMKCGEEENLTFEEIAKRSAELCSVAEKYAPDTSKLIYVIGTEVPIPGGEIEEPTALDVTSKLSLDRTITSHKKAWESHGIMDSWGRIAAIVAQPGVDFGHSNIFTYQPEKSQRLSAHLKNYKSLVFEAHSTDYQPNHSLHDLVKQHFMFLKVGPELTFKFREAIFALSEIASEMGSEVGIDLKNTIRDAMHENPEHWEPYYSGSMSEIEFMQKYSFSDRIRYYWPTPKVADALNKLIEFLSSNQINETLVGQNFMSYDFGDHPIDPVDLINNHIHQSIRRYYQACGFT